MGRQSAPILDANWGEIQNFGWLGPNLRYITEQVSPSPVLVIDPSTPTKCEIIGQIAPTITMIYNN